ncbi:MAG: FapA family protein [Nitrospirota bacterium]
MNTQSGIEKEITVKISPDGMNAFLTIQPANLHGELMDVEMVLERLWNEEVTVGIKNQLIAEMLKHRIYGKSILIAEGIPAEDGQDAVIDYKFKKHKRVNLTEDLDGRVDFRESGLIEIVREGEILATKIPLTRGIPGRKITGEEIKANDGQDISITAGKNTQLSPDKTTLTAIANGYIVWENNIPDIETTYAVNGDVDMKTGNIYFVGPVKIHGDVAQGFSVTTEGSIEIWGGTDNAVLRADGEIIVYGGIRKGRVYAKGDVRCKFIENAKVETKGNVVVRDAILHSEITAGNSVIVLEGNKGAIMGGSIKAKTEVNAKNIGSMSEVLTSIEVGVDPGMRDELFRLEESIRMEKHELHQAKLNYNSLMAQQNSELAKQYLDKKSDLENSIHLMTTSLHQIKKHVTSTNEGKICAFDTLWPGVKITIGMATFTPKIDYRYITFVNIAGKIDTKQYEGTKVKVEVPTRQIGYWEREIDRVRGGKE